jgi:crotonobetaine/carnitine-CoA ligase
LRALYGGALTVAAVIRGDQCVGAPLGRLLEWHAASQGERPFLVYEDVESGDRLEHSYEEAFDRARRTASVLVDCGIGSGDRFHVHLTNCPEFLDCWFAAALIGAVFVPTNPLLTSDEVRFVLGHASCRVSITQADLAHAVLGADATNPMLLAGEGEGGIQGLGPAVAAARPFEPRPVSATDALGVLYTSATTSRPKGVLVTDAAYAHAGEAVAQHIRLRPDDRQLIVLPLFHGNALYYSTMSALVTGASIALCSRFSASRWSASATRLAATVASLFAAPIRMILAAPPSAEDRRHRLRLALFAQNVSDAQLEEFERRFAVPLAQPTG